jgi:hypothetical protein
VITGAGDAIVLQYCNVSRCQKPHVKPYRAIRFPLSSQASSPAYRKLATMALRSFRKQHALWALWGRCAVSARGFATAEQQVRVDRGTPASRAQRQRADASAARRTWWSSGVALAGTSRPSRAASWA